MLKSSLVYRFQSIDWADPSHSVDINRIEPDINKGYGSDAYFRKEINICNHSLKKDEVHSYIYGRRRVNPLWPACDAIYGGIDLD